MQSDKKKYFSVYVDRKGVVTFDTNIDNSDFLIKVLAVTNASAIDILTKETGRDDITELLIHDTAAALNEINKEGGEADESNE